MKPCDTCNDNSSAREVNRQLDIIRAEAKLKAVETETPKAICKDENGFFITDAGTAISERYQIKEFVSHL